MNEEMENLGRSNQATKKKYWTKKNVTKKRLEEKNRVK